MYSIYAASFESIALDPSPRRTRSAANVADSRERASTVKVNRVREAHWPRARPDVPDTREARRGRQLAQRMLACNLAGSAV